MRALQLPVLLARTLLVVVVVGGCASGHRLMPTPNIVRDRGYPEEQVALTHRNNRVTLVYATDRFPEFLDGTLTYGSRRSASTGYGLASVEIGDGISWEALVELSESEHRGRNSKVRVRSISEEGRFPDTPRPFTIVDGMAVETEEARANLQASEEGFLALLHQQLAIARDKDVLLFVHGFNNSFDEAARVEAEMWHFLGRRGVPVLYSWPAAHGGLFGYFTDRESGEFTIYHLKELLRLLSSSPEVERIHVLAHSRGTDVVTTALRELVIETRAAGNNPHESLRIANLLLAAPDLDFGVVSQRLMAEKFGAAIGQITIYTAQTDKALGVSQTLMSGTRFGRVQASDLGATESAIFDDIGNVNIIDVEGGSGVIGHGYFHSNPAASSDVILILREGSLPGQNSRPLMRKMLNFWTMPEDYPPTSEVD